MEALVTCLFKRTRSSLGHPLQNLLLTFNTLDLVNGISLALENHESHILMQKNEIWFPVESLTPFSMIGYW